jgi:hypothetical protein
MSETNLHAEFDHLRPVPEHCFGEPASERWLQLYSSLLTYQAPSAIFLLHKERKWELASAFQKAIRRADKATVLPLIYGMASVRATKISKTADLRLSNSMVLHRKPRTSTMRETRCSRHIGPSTNNGTHTAH